MRRSGFLAALILTVLAVAPVASADLESDLADVKDRIADFRSELNDASADRTELAEQVLAIDVRLSELGAELDAAQARLDETDAEMLATQAAVAELQSTIDGHTARLGDLRGRADRVEAAARERAIELYMAPWPGEASDTEADLAAGASVALVYAERVQRIADRDIAALEALWIEEQRTIAAVEAERADLKVRLAELEDAREIRELAEGRVVDRQAEVQGELIRQQALLAEVDDLIGEIEGEITGLAAEQWRIEALIIEEQRLGGDAPGILSRPVPGAVTSWFGYRIHPIYGDRRLHTGLDMNAYCGEPIRSGGEGRVFLADWKGGYGIAVMVDHGGGLSTLYAHLSSTAVGYGQWVGAGEVIGYGGTTGVSTACHLHFEVRLSGTPVDPVPYL